MDFMFQRMQEFKGQPAFIWNDRAVDYSQLSDLVSQTRTSLSNIPSGSIVSLEADFSPMAVAALFVLMDKGAIVAPLTSDTLSRQAEFRQIAQIEIRVQIKDERISIERTETKAEHAYYSTLRSKQHPGLILFSSGSSGTPKAAVHDFATLLNRYKVQGKPRRMASFLLFDHIGGLNTLFYSLSSGGCLVLLGDRSPAVVASAIERHRIGILPTSPTFLNLFLLSEVWKNHDLSSLETVTYGTEPMPESTLTALSVAFPKIRFQQTYGLSEVGILKSRSRDSNSLWMKVGGDGYETRIVEGLLEIKAESAMLGYLNAPSPFTDDGWFKTGDAVEVDGEWIKVLGRRSELINVGGEKVYPAEVENVLHTMDGVAEVVVSAEAHLLIGQIVKATIRLSKPEDPESFRKRMRIFCKGKLPAFKIPQKIEFRNEPLHNARFKSVRLPA